MLEPARICRNKIGWVPLMLAAERGDALTTMAFLASGADANSENREWHHSLMLAAASGDIATVRALSPPTAGVNDHRDDGHTALFSAAEHGSVDIIKLLILNGADVGRQKFAWRDRPRQRRPPPDPELITAMRDAGAKCLPG